jgi:hypothetical protein
VAVVLLRLFLTSLLSQAVALVVVQQCGTLDRVLVAEAEVFVVL